MLEIHSLIIPFLLTRRNGRVAEGGDLEMGYGSRNIARIPFQPIKRKTLNGEP
jgi:hypothetical protein